MRTAMSSLELTGRKTMASSLKFAIAVLLLAYLYARLQHGWHIKESREAQMVRLGSKVVASDLLKRGRLWRDLTGCGERLRHNSLTNRPYWFLDSLLLLAGDIELNPGPLRKGVRPMPDVTFMGKFIMCDGTRCIGSKCTFPHSESEMHAWNLQKFGQPAQTEVQTGPGRLRKGIRPVPNVEFDGKFVLCDGTRCIGLKCTFPHSEAEKCAWNLHRSGEPVQSGAAQKDAQQQQEHVARAHARETGMMQATSQSYPKRSAVQNASADTEQTSTWAAVVQKKNVGPVSSLRYKHQDGLSALKLPLTCTNYREKFKALLYAEENEHQKVLETKYNRCCRLSLFKRGYRPHWLSYPHHQYVRFGILNGLDNNKIAYVAQASGRVIISKHKMHICEADILSENTLSVVEDLYIGFNEDNSKHIETSELDTEIVFVDFELNHSYFRTLRQAVDNLSDSMVENICPTTSSCFQVDSIPDEHLLCYKCSPDQFAALKVIASCSARSPPVIISGAFGTGKTRLLAIASRYFIDNKQTTTRVLACTQQWISAEFFLKCYLGLMTSGRDTEVYIIKDYGGFKKELKKFYTSIDNFKHHLRNNSKNLLIITTCQTAPRLVAKNAVPPGFFTHILLDEGAQTREPEAIAPLRMATPDTKIVIAGDKNQVGPAVLVLGEEARANGLAVSLQQRLEECYQKIGVSSHLAILSTSYRCHQDILELVGELFYDVRFRMPTDQDSPTTHPLAHYPLLFVCSNVDSHVNATDDSTNQAEADIILDEVVRFCNPWPHLQWGDNHLEEVCVMSVSKKQISVVKNLIKKRETPKLAEIRCCSTYEIQGKECHAVFLSTSEHTATDGCTSNPTKSLCDPYIFNTAITRAQSLVVSVGNPFMLLKMEKHMIETYGKRGKCWSNYLKRCLKNYTVTFHDSLKLTDEEKTDVLLKLQTEVDERLVDLPATTDVCEEQQESLQDCPTAPEEDLQRARHSHSDAAHYSSNEIDSRASLVKIKARKGDQIGIGAFGYVCVMHDGDKKYAGKFFHEEFMKNTEDFQTKFQDESMLLSHLHHEHIVAYCGACFGFDCLLMELLHCSLDDFVSGSEDKPFSVKISILWDVAKGLSYLHNTDRYPVIHRDLTAKNVLLNSDTPPIIAKISDFGNARVIDAEAVSERRSLTKGPGTPAYMPPEACTRKYDQKLDIFSFGHLAIYAIIQKKIDLLPATFPVTGGQVQARSEVQRRQESIADLQIHCKSADARKLIIKCLNNDPKERPKSCVLASRLDTIVQLDPECQVAESSKSFGDSASSSGSLGIR